VQCRRGPVLHLPKAGTTTKAMLSMSKLDIATLTKAFDAA
jgi:hypothetical protein